MKLKDKFAITMAHGVTFLAKLLKRGGTSLPGEVALKFSPDLPQALLKDKELILISGTNGKTSTLHFLASVYEQLGYSVVANWSGANLIYGITTSLLKSKAPEAGKKRVYIFEIDEAHLAKYAEILNPKHLILTNLFEDQTDRYGSVSELRERLRQGLNKLNNSVKIYLPSDDPQLAVIGHSRPENCYYFGREIDTDAAEFLKLCRQKDQEDIAFDSLGEQLKASCPACGAKLHYAWRSMGQHGGFCCSNCELSWQQPDLAYRFTEAGNCRL
ncbi:MAG: Mur ligase family protein, partial [Eubacteriales bacterium]|nr:Mur ligase family protein [Eubacteriales bacterium]